MISQAEQKPHNGFERPANVEAEFLLLAMCILDGSLKESVGVMGGCVEKKVSASHFTHQSAVTFWEALYALWETRSRSMR